ncbi:MAG: hypothetical protein IKO28_06300 [Prevotella sp.]|nr:hypothetical protein [Prevotella sp.]MBR4650991.1 hypothetical protein [Prevotella sp.]
MNYYLRYFDDETLVYSVDDAIAFLASISEINLTPELEAEVREYLESDVMYPKRYKVRPRIYFIIIKTEAQSMQDFKDKKALRKDLNASGGSHQSPEQIKLMEEHYGWYEGRVDFKRVVVNHIGKCEYRDTAFTARCIAESPMDCYNRIIDHLKSRVDERSQFPSPKGKNYNYTFLGELS